MREKSYRVMVVDDEYWGRENLLRAIDWEDYGFVILEPACDGEEALARLKQEPVDILLTDIDMPFMDGLELMKRLKVSYPEICCIAVSGYDDFDKVKGFFLSGGIDYLLKPVGKEELVKVLTKVLETLEKRSRQVQDSTRVSSLLEDNEYSSLLNRKLYGGKRGSEHVGCMGGFSQVSVVMVKFHDIFRIADSYGREKGSLSGLLKERLRSLLGEGMEEPPIVFNYTAKMSEFLLVGKFPSSLLESLGKQVEEAFPLPDFGPVTVVIHSALSTLDELGATYRELMATLVTRPFSRSFYCLSCKEEVVRLKEHLDHRLEVELVRQLSGGNWEAAGKLIFEKASFGDCLSGGWIVLETEQFLARLTGTLEEVVRSTYPDHFWALEDLVATLEVARRQLDSAMAVKAVGDFLEEFQEGDEEPKGGADQLMQVRAFLEENYGESISLPFLAQKFHLDPNYLSRSYSQRFSETITGSLTRIRISRAIEMMHDSERKLESISFMVGYDDYNYFSRVFRKKVGKSPSEYRKSILA